MKQALRYVDVDAQGLQRQTGNKGLARRNELAQFNVALRHDARIRGAYDRVFELLFRRLHAGARGIETCASRVALGLGLVETRPGDRVVGDHLLGALELRLRVGQPGPRFCERRLRTIQRRALLRVREAHDDRARFDKIIYIVGKLGNAPRGLRRNRSLVHRLNAPVEDTLARGNLVIYRSRAERNRGRDRCGRQQGGQENRKSLDHGSAPTVY